MLWVRLCGPTGSPAPHLHHGRVMWPSGELVQLLCRSSWRCALSSLLVHSLQRVYFAETPQHKWDLPGFALLATTLKNMQTLNSSASTAVLKVMMCSSVFVPSTRSHVIAEWWSATSVLLFMTPWFAKSAGGVHGLWDASAARKNGQDFLRTDAFAESVSH